MADNKWRKEGALAVDEAATDWLVFQNAERRHFFSVFISGTYDGTVVAEIREVPGGPIVVTETFTANAEVTKIGEFTGSFEVRLRMDQYTSGTANVAIRK
ncbi:MAG: hypothetical protein V3W41_22380 [Planctomycetota bacterium]